MNYLILIRRADFIDLYKYGFLNVNKDRIVPFECAIHELGANSDIFDLVFSEANSFDSSFAYLILHYEKEENSKNLASISIEEIKHIFPLDNEAKKEFESSFDEHIRIDEPIWSDAVSLIQKRQIFESAMQGARNVFNIFRLDGLQQCKSIIDDDSVEEMLSDVYDNIRPSGEKSLWIYLMMYERHSFYPKDTLGYYMDVVHVICNYMAKCEVEDYQVESTAIYKILDSLKGFNLKSNEINDKLKQDERAAGFLQKIQEFVPEVDFIGVAINYLVMRDRFSEEFTYDPKFVESCKYSFGQSFTLAAYMLGIALTHDNTYSCLYESLPLPIYKSQEEMERIKQRKQYEKEKAQREMQRIEDERERERQMRSEYSRNNGKKKKKSYNPFDRSSYSYGGRQSGYGYSTYHDEPFSSFQEPEQPSYGSSFREEVPSLNQETAQPDKIIKKGKTESPSLFGNDVMDDMENENRKLLSFPLTMQKFRANGKPSTAKDAERVVKTPEEYKKLMESKDIWRIKK